VRIYHTIALLALSPYKRNGRVCTPGVVSEVFSRGGVKGGLRYGEEKKKVGKGALEMNLLLNSRNCTDTSYQVTMYTLLLFSLNLVLERRVQIPKLTQLST
jgi:hypothetical protein